MIERKLPSPSCCGLLRRALSLWVQSQRIVPPRSGAAMRLIIIITLASAVRCTLHAVRPTCKVMACAGLARLSLGVIVWHRLQHGKLTGTWSNLYFWILIHSIVYISITCNQLLIYYIFPSLLSLLQSPQLGTVCLVAWSRGQPTGN